MNKILTLLNEKVGSARKEKDDLNGALKEEDKESSSSNEDVPNDNLKNFDATDSSLS